MGGMVILLCCQHLYFAKMFTLIHTSIYSWFVGFALMWLVIGNMNVLPLGILPLALPLSILEALDSKRIFKLSTQGLEPERKFLEVVRWANVNTY